MVAVPTAANAGYYARIVREQAILRRLVEAGTRITQLGYAGDGDVDDVVDRAQAEIYQVTERRTSEDYQPLSAIMQGTLDEIEAIDSHDGTLVGVPTGFADLDSVTNGLHPGQMIIVAGGRRWGRHLPSTRRCPRPPAGPRWARSQSATCCSALTVARPAWWPRRSHALATVLQDHVLRRHNRHRRCRTPVADHTRTGRRIGRGGGAPVGTGQLPVGQIHTTKEVAATLRCETTGRSGPTTR